MKKISERPILITFITLTAILIFYMLYIGVTYIINNENSKKSSPNDMEKNYHIASYILQNNSTEKIEKIIVDSNASSSDMQDIYEEREAENSNYNTYTIWFFSSDEKAQSLKEYELGSATKKDNSIEIVNVKEEKAEQEYEEYQKELAQQEKERQEREEKEKAQEEKNFKADCKNYTYKDLARNPDKIEGKKVKLTGEVIQTLYDSESVDLRVNITKEGTYSTYYTDTIYVVYYPEEGEDKILEDDIITIWGTAKGDYTYTSAIGTKVTLPLVFAEYVTID